MQVTVVNVTMNANVSVFNTSTIILSKLSTNECQ